VRIFLAGAIGVIGRPLVPALLGAGYEVPPLARRPEKVRALEAQGAEPALAEAVDVEGVPEAVVLARPEVLARLRATWPRWREGFAAVHAGAAQRARVAA
jgi:nucleoside-diphosphate-sugar epimerase